MTFPAPVPPMLAALGTLPSGGGWAYEYKWDGVRAVVYVRGEDVRILSRNERDVTRLRRRSGGTSGARQALAAYRDATLFKVIYAWGRNGAVSRVAATSSP